MSKDNEVLREADGVVEGFWVGAYVMG